jgi:hypothetical protein
MADPKTSKSHISLTNGKTQVRFWRERVLNQELINLGDVILCHITVPQKKFTIAEFDSELCDTICEWKQF